MKIILYILLLSVTCTILNAQVVYERNDYFEAGDNFPVVRYTNTNDNVGQPINLFLNEGTYRIVGDTGFEYCLIDSVVYFVASEYDTIGNFPEATCMSVNEMGFEVFMIVSDTSVLEVGIQGILPFVNLPYSLMAADSLKSFVFPSQIGTQTIDNGSLSQKFLVTEFESIIPPDSYALITALYDTVKVQVEISIYSEFVNETQLFIRDTNTFEATRTVLCEYKEVINSMDILLRSKFSNQYSSLSTVPGVSDMLPIELPIVDSSQYFNYYANEYGIPLLSCKINIARDTVYSMRVYNGDNSFIPFHGTKLSVDVFPNPVSNSLNFEFETYEKGNLTIFDINGKLVSKMDFNAKNIIFETANLKSGLYVYSIETDSNKYHKGKFQILH